MLGRRLSTAWQNTPYLAFTVEKRRSLEAIGVLTIGDPEMTAAVSNGYLFFNATDSGTALTPTSSYLLDSFDYSVFDNGVGAGDGNADTATDYFSNTGIPYSGYTIEINGNDYAIFATGTGYHIPYFDAVEDLSGLDGTAVNAADITQTGENAVVVNLCFVGGTMIATPDGEQLVEELAIGDMVRTADGRDVAVKWVGRQVMMSPVNVAMDERRAPVCIKAGALGNHSDLFVSADHGMIVDGLVINASALVNGDTIRFVPASEMPTEFTYYHIETEAHDIILANGAASETFIDAAGRKVFDNYQEYLDLYGVERIIPEMNRPRISSQRMVPPVIKDRLRIATNRDVLRTG